MSKQKHKQSKQRRRQHYYVKQRNQRRMRKRQQLNQQQQPRQPSKVQQLLDKPTSMTTNIGLIIAGCGILGIGLWLMVKLQQWL